MSSSKKAVNWYQLRPWFSFDIEPSLQLFWDISLGLCQLDSRFQFSPDFYTEEINTRQDPRAGYLALHLRLRRSNCRLGCSRNGCNCTQRSGSLQIVIFMFSARAGNISLAPIHFPPYLSALIRETPPVAVPQIRSALPSLLLLSRCGLHLPPGKRFVGPIALRTIAIAGHFAKCPDHLDCHWHWLRVAHHRKGSD